jgi:hypothetical protein
MDFESTELRITLIQKAVARAFNIDHSAVEPVLECSCENPSAGGLHKKTKQTTGQNCCTITSRILGYSRMTRFIRFPIRTKNFEMKNCPQEDATVQLLRVFLEAAIEGTRSHPHYA